MTPRLPLRFEMLALSVLGVMVIGVIWSADRAIEITDEAYYILSGHHPDRIEAYISAQHWILAPLWALTGTLTAFRLAGLAILLGGAGVLGWGTYRVATELGMVARAGPVFATLCAGSAVGALLYVSTIAPSPSYNLLASAGGYAGLGFAFLVAMQTRWGAALACALAGGGALAVAFVNKPSAGVCCLGLSLIALWALRGGGGGLGRALVLGVGFVAGVLGLFAWHATQSDVLTQLQAGLALFRQVQTEPIPARLLRYGLSWLEYSAIALVIFAPVLVLCRAAAVAPRRWMPLAIAGLLLVSILADGKYLGGMTEYKSQIEAMMALLAATALCSGAVWSGQGRRVVLVASLFGLPYAVAMGTGNALFSQVIVSLAPWSGLACLLALSRPVTAVRGQAARVCAGMMLVLICAQVLSSYTRDPYHLAAPLTGQTTAVTAPVLGALRVDPPTATLLTDLERARTTCGIAPGAAFLGAYNVPGLALLLEAAPPVSPWINNRTQLLSILETWSPEGRVILALSPEAQAARDQLPAALQPVRDRFALCGTATVPFSGARIEIWASLPR